MKPENLEAYELIRDEKLESLDSRGMLLRHKKSGARICLIQNDDENKVFYIGFRTPPVNDTGLTHILEHSVLCGSREFPVKDPFIELVKGSLNTFLNAMTYPDKTVYPVASCNDKDFQNLMHVYMDAVFHPAIYEHREIFCQEGWHYELDSSDGELTVNGVVYNEMKGAFSSADSMLEREILNSLYPDTAYRFESGGDPQHIPELTYEEFLDFHSKYYHPSNSYIYLYGNMDAAGKLIWLDEHYLSEYDIDDFDTAIQLQEPFDAPVKLVKKYPVTAGEDTQNKTYLSCSWSISTSLEREHYLAFELLDYALLNSQGAPLKQALLDAGIGMDIQGGYDNGVYQPIFSVIAKNANPQEEEQFLEIIRTTLSAQVKEGIDQESLLAAINHSEFKYRESDYGNFPKGLIYGLQAFDSWLYDDNEPFMHLELLDTYQYLREQIGTGYYEKLVQEYLIDNPHVSIVRMEPEQGLNAKNEQALADKLQAYKDTLSEEELEEIAEFAKHLREYQEEENTQEELETIPMLEIKDIRREVLPFCGKRIGIGDVPALFSEIPTNGIVYLDLLFDTGHIPQELVPYLGLLKLLIGYMDTDTYSYAQLANEINLHTGGISNSVTLFADSHDTYAYESKFEVRISVLAAKLEKAMELAVSMLLHTDFSDDKRLYELLAQIKAALQSDLSGSGHIVASTRALGSYLPRARYSDLTSGIGFYRLVDRLESGFEEEKEDLKEKLALLVNMLFRKEKLFVQVTCEADALDAVKDQVKGLLPELSAVPIRDQPARIICTPKNEGFMDASQVQYVAQAGNFREKGYSYTGAFRVLKTILSYDYLWLNVRVKGGAYGTSGNFTRTGDAYFASYRDPNLADTYAVYEGIPAYLEQFDVSERDMTKYIIGTISGMDTPLNPKAKGRRNLMAYFGGLTEEQIQRERDEVLDAVSGDIRVLAAPVAAALSCRCICTIGNEDRIRENEELFDEIEHLYGRNTDES